MNTPSHRKTMATNRDGGARPPTPSRKVLASDPDPKETGTGPKETHTDPEETSPKSKVAGGKKSQEA